MRDRNFGRVICISSINGQKGQMGQAHYSAAKGGIVSLTRSAAFALRKYGVNANCIAPAAMTRMSENVPFEIEAGSPEAIAPLAVWLMSDAARDVTAQIYTCTGKRIAVWNQPAEIRHMWADDGASFSVDEIAEKLPATIGDEEMPMFADLERRMNGAIASLRTEFASLRTGRGSASMLEPVMVEAYGSMKKDIQLHPEMVNEIINMYLN